MDIKKSFQILEVRVGASETEVRQAYRDMVSVWHPDRFSANPRLRRKAEEKLKEANAAYETLRSFFNGRMRGSDPSNTSEGNVHGSAGERRENGRGGHKNVDQEGENGRRISRTEIFVETGTEVVLTLWTHLAGKLGRFLSDTGKRK